MSSNASNSLQLGHRMLLQTTRSACDPNHELRQGEHVSIACAHLSVGRRVGQLSSDRLVPHAEQLAARGSTSLGWI